MPNLDDAAAVADTPITEDVAAPVGVLNPNRDATPADAENLARIHDMLTDAASDVSTRNKTFKLGFNAEATPEGRTTLRDLYEAAVTAYNDRMDQCWLTIFDMPKGTSVGGATRHSVALQHYGGHLTSTFGIRMTQQDAKAANKLAFGK